MLTNKTINVSAKSEVTIITEDGEKTVTAMNLNGYVNANGDFSVTRNIHNPEAYHANKAQMLADAEEFENMMISASTNSEV